MNYSTLVIVLAVLVLVTNIIVQLVKDISCLKERPTKVVALIVAVILTVCTTVAYFQIKSLVLTWYIIVAAVIIGFIVAYGAIFGFDNLYGELLDKLKDLFGKKGGM